MAARLFEINEMLRIFAKLESVCEKCDFEIWEISRTQTQKRSFEIIQFRNLSKSRSNFLSCTRKKILSPQNEVDVEHLTRDFETVYEEDFENLAEIVF